MNIITAVFLSIITGVCLALQPPINAALGKSISAKLATWHSLVSSAIVMTLYIIITSSFTQYKNILQTSPIYWSGGMLGVVIVFSSILVIPKLGAATTFTIFISVQIIFGVIIDHYKLFGVPGASFNLYKLIGILLVILGVRFIMK